MWHTYISPINMTCSVPNLVWEAVDPFHWIQRPVVWSWGQHLQAWSKHTHPYSIHKNIHTHAKTLQWQFVVNPASFYFFLSSTVFCLFLLRLTKRGITEIILRQFYCMLVVIGSDLSRLVNLDKIFNFGCRILCVENQTSTGGY